MRTGVSTLLLCTVVAGCTPSPTPVPDPGRGVGFGDYAAYELERARREALLTGTPVATPVPQTTLGPTPNTQVIPSSELAAAGIGAAGGTVPATSGGLGNATVVDPTQAATVATAAPTTTVPVATPTFNNPSISDEQDFNAVTSRETIESDAQRRAQQAQNLIVVEPVPLPTQRADSGPNIVQYAVNAPNVKGQQWYSRSLLSGDGRFQRNCATYGSPDAAQRDFLIRGGPERDPRGIDPDGDGFACGWDPAPFR